MSRTSLGVITRPGAGFVQGTSRFFSKNRALRSSRAIYSAHGIPALTALFLVYGVDYVLDVLTLWEYTGLR